MRILVCITLIALALGCSANADQSPRFEDFAVTNLFKGTTAVVDLSSHPEARHYRTELRRQAAEGADFAGHYKIAIWGCGSSCAQFAIVDSQSGRVYFPRELSYYTWADYDGTNFGLQYRLDSKLLVLHGSPAEEPQVGAFYYVWQTNSLLLIRKELKK